MVAETVNLLSSWLKLLRQLFPLVLFLWQKPKREHWGNFIRKAVTKGHWHDTGPFREKRCLLLHYTGRFCCSHSGWKYLKKVAFNNVNKTVRTLLPKKITNKRSSLRSQKNETFSANFQTPWCSLQCIYYFFFQTKKDFPGDGILCNVSACGYAYRSLPTFSRGKDRLIIESVLLFPFLWVVLLTQVQIHHFRVDTHESHVPTICRRSRVM